MHVFSSFDVYVLFYMSVAQVALLVSCLVKLASIGQQVFDHHRRIQKLEDRK